MKPVVVALVCAAGVVSGCVEEPAPDPAVPMVVLATATIQAADTVDHVRHGIERGEPMREALAALEDAAQTLVVAAGDAEATPAQAESLTAETAEVIAAAAGQGHGAAAALRAEATHLENLAAADEELEAALAAWDDPEQATAQWPRLLRLIRDLRNLDLVPPDCPRLRDNRVRWAELMADRSQRLAEAAAGGAPTGYAELRDAYLRAPFGEDRAAADAADRACWWRHSAVARHAEAVESWMSALERTVS